MPSPVKFKDSTNRITDFDDEEESDETESDSSSAVTSASTLTSASAANAAATAASKADKPFRGAARAARDAAAGDALGGSDMGLSLLDKPEALEDAYLQLTHSLGQHNQRAGRVRAAARCWGRRAEVLLERGEVGVAQARLSALADLYLVGPALRNLDILWLKSVYACSYRGKPMVCIVFISPTEFRNHVLVVKK